jgi:hypothetical protein
MLFQPHDGVNINHRMFANYVEARWYCAKVRMVNFLDAQPIQNAKGQEKTPPDFNDQRPGGNFPLLSISAE